jgi:SpoVK/Ycf46/Vps4 family AAA+-type ATPase
MTRVAILEAQLQERPNTLDRSDLRELANMTEGMVAADLGSLVEDAARVALDRGGDTLQWDDFVTALEEQT